MDKRTGVKPAQNRCKVKGKKRTLKICFMAGEIMGETKMWIGIENISELISPRCSLIFICWGGEVTLRDTFIFLRRSDNRKAVMDFQGPYINLF
jgi:hypothetical protein